MYVACGMYHSVYRLFQRKGRKECKKQKNMLLTYLSTDYFGTRLIIFDNNINTIGDHFSYQVRGQISCIYD